MGFVRHNTFLIFNNSWSKYYSHEEFEDSKWFESRSVLQFRRFTEYSRLLLFRNKNLVDLEIMLRIRVLKNPSYISL